MIDECNTYLDSNKPWELFKDETNKDRVNTILYNVFQAFLETYSLLNAFLPESTTKVLKKFNINNIKIDENNSFNFEIDGLTFEKGEPLFIRLDINKEIEELYEIANS